MSDTPFIEISGLYKIFGEQPQQQMPLVKAGKSKQALLSETGHTLGLRDINLSVQRGEVFVVMGLSGSGKSTLIRHFNRLIEPTCGRICIDGEDIMQLDDAQLRHVRQRKMSMVFQRFGLLPHYSVIDNVALGLEVQKISKQQRQSSARLWLERVGLSEYQEHYPAQLSGGQQQRVGLARALATDADILLMDEAFSALDPLIRSEMQEQLIELQRELHKTIVFITHDLDEALRIGDRIAILRDGELVQVGTPAQILLQPADDYVEKFVRDVNRARALNVSAVMQPATHALSAATIDEALAHMRTHDTDYAFYVNGQGYQGVVSRAHLAGLANTQGQSQLTRDHCDSVEAVPPDAILESVIPQTLQQTYPLAVVDNDGQLIGQLSRHDLVSVLARVE
ncbi:glycine betaine/L-proline ABC transporter ATP-binding protein [Bacterioplanes sanyensis]|uniref:Quaternary amine transport ATP-binding protein n=1 Tax=Bacterioplanes sanyensis TaxID=1249553 RepID=A0A222FMW2_9GAMM|nr:glycine betaine/L-proline ABC transporter ATP-binding protein [Bacterioplanes sanyensis]ASP40089.1 glycine betaine/L-proline ABC transporter ATP-binding protein [Bacterioplanes sanyensis]